ncbi:aspartate aminotransferase family protein [Magnetospirillum molischianum]|uniref:Acetylornithine aminotransferase n=1 Tax=Magnetospirillum molischianum DSM 120 TaxID=1150626 RepID=H8FW19_MAGML|nr:aspartate aminotransferase family protein [Magnetospirillum molischianum]CCG42557.1 acetylornithine transaminase (NAcOATase and DapATase), PLP-dependent [Magnetospirillum molischianum DSM 120]
MVAVVLPTYARADLAFDRGEGAYLYSTDGRRYLDFAAGVAVNALGHCHPRLVAALTAQAGKLWHCSNLYRVPGQEQVATRLIEASFADTVFFCNSGAEAMECCIKTARRYHHVGGHPERYRIICAEGAFHGRTLATIAAGGQKKHLDGFAPIVDGFDHVPFGNLNALRAAITAETAAILVEPVLGEGGIIPAEPDYLRRLRETADEFGLLLIFDEVQTGIGRSGKLFAHEWSGITPDIMGIAKGLGGGFPVGACLVTEQAARGMTPGTHGSTFGGNPLAMSVAETVLDMVLEPGFLTEVERIAQVLRREIETVAARFPTLIEDVRGLGLMLGIKPRFPNTELIARLRDNGMLAVGAGDNVVRLVPPLIIREAEVALAADILSRTLSEVVAPS